MRAHSSPKRATLDLNRRPEGGPGGTGPVVVPPGGPPLPTRDVATTLLELVDQLIALAASERTAPATPPFDLPLLLDAVEAGRLLSISRSKVLDLAARGHLPSLRVGGSVRIPRDQLIEWISDHSVSASHWSATGSPGPLTHRSAAL